MDKGTRTILLALAILSLVSIVTAVRFFVSEKETFEKYLVAKENLLQERSKLNQEKVRLNRKLSASIGELNNLKGQLDELVQQRDVLEKETTSLLQEREKLSTQLVELERKMKGVESQPLAAPVFEEKARLEVEAEDLKERLKSQQMQLGEVTRAKEKLASELERRKIEARVVETLSRDLAEAKRDKFIAVETLGQVEIENRGFKERLAQLLEIETSLEEELMATKGELSRTSEEKDRLQNQLKRASETKSIFEENLLVARDGLQRVGEERERLAGELATVKLTLKEREEEIGHVKTKLANLEENLSVARDELQRVSKEKDNLAEKLTTVRLALKEKEEEVGRIKATLAKAKEETRKLEELAGLSKGKPGSIELSPIVVKADTLPTPTGKILSKLPQGRIVTVNDKHKFVVIDLGREDGLETGMVFTVCREDKEVGVVEIIEVHQEVSAADIKAESIRAGIRVDDIVVPGQ